MHAWLIARFTDFQCNVSLSAPLLPCAHAPIVTDTDFPLTHAQASRDAHTLFHDIVACLSTHSLLSLKPRPLWILTVLHFKLNIPLVSLQHGFFYTVTNCAEYTFFPGSQSLEEPAIAACSYIWYYYSCAIEVNGSP